MSPAIAGAFHKGKVYHRDVSLGNVMMTERQGDHEGPWGVLNDWDHALWTDADPTDRVVSFVVMILWLQSPNIGLL